jgi:glycosyltransferase involved in cell wall biosynthesis
MHPAMPVARDPKLPLSCFIIARNEADRIAAVIERVAGWVDEVVVVDSGSDDGTQEIATRLGARVIHNDWPGYGPQKRFAEDQCRNDWLLNLDADEVPSKELCREIIALFGDGVPDHPFYRFRVRIVYPGDTEPRRWAPNNNCLRLYDRRAGRFDASTVHDTVRTNGIRPGQLRGEVAHFSYRSFSYLVEKLNFYGDLQAASLESPPRAVLLIRLPVEMPWCFLKYYLLRRHFTGGVKGFIFASVNAFFRFLKLAKMLEAKPRK